MEKDLSGKKFGKLTALETVRTEEKQGLIWRCRCDCGREKEVPARYLIRGTTRSCGCMKNEHPRSLYDASRAVCSSYRQDLIEDTSLSSLIVSKNLRRNNTSGCTGVSWDPKRGLWTAYITFQKKRYFLGSFSKLEDAVMERKKAERRRHDPVIEEHLENMSEESRMRFREYLVGKREE